MEPWSADDPWQERRDPSSDWDEWSPQAPPPDEYAVDEPEPPASDPWAESWADEVPGIPASPPVESDRDSDRGTDAVSEPPPPVFEPRFSEPEPEPRSRRQSPNRSRCRPRSPNPPMHPASSRGRRTPIRGASPGPCRRLWTSRQPKPRPSRPRTHRSPTSTRASKAPAETPTEDDWQQLEPDPEPALWAGPAEPTTVSANGDQPASEAPPTRDAVAEPGPEPEPEPEPAFIAPIWAAEPGPSTEDEAAAGVPESETTWEPDLWAEPEAEAEPAPTPEPDVEPEPELTPEAGAEDIEPAESTVSPEAAAAAALAASRLDVDAPPDAPWPERIDPTEVLPTTWAAATPEPREDDGIEARSGEVRTTLGGAEPELDEEPGEEPTTAEAAVPWLIGVILLLAGMVIVLLALIFAGDASLGGGAGATPSQEVAILVPSGSVEPSAAPSPTPRPSPSPSPSGSAEASATPAAAAQYGDLEMVYQGRSEALEPIYLLRRDFTVEGEPAVLTQDASLNVNRHAWSADGTKGACLYGDRLVGIDPGVDVHLLSEGIHAIAFGDEAATVFAVRVTAEGGNDVASVVAVKQAGGEERELDRVSYARPQPGAEAPLTEAQFLDDGGAIRLYWMHDDTLRLWILGAGAWTIDPAEGNATKLEDDALPVLWSPDGERRIGLAPEGNTTQLIIVDRSGDRNATATVPGRVSHLRWSPRGDQVVFTLGRSAPGGGILQDLYLWNLGEGEDPEPMLITNTGAAFGAEWLGSQSRWEED